MTTEDTTTTTIVIDDGATVTEPAVRGGTQYEVNANKGVCYYDVLNGVGTTEFGFLPCDASYEGEIIVIEPQVAVGQPPVPTVTALPETGSEPVMLGLGAILLVIGLGLRKLAHR